MNSLQQAWCNTWAELGVKTADLALCDALLARYAEPHRHYHTLQHLQECLNHFAALRHLAERPAEIELALWFHDAIYDIKRQDNELRSAAWAHEALLTAGVDSAIAERVHALILATQHQVAPTSHDAQLLVDVDLAILGANEDRFAEYEQQVRKEYGWVPGFLFNRNRRRILASFLAREPIYQIEECRKLFENNARRNLQRALGK